MSGALTADVGSLLTVVGGRWEHSALFRFLEEHHDAILARQNGARMSWGRLCDWFAGAGLNNGHGVQATPSCARKTWYRVRMTVAAVRRAADERAAELAMLEEKRRLEADAARDAAREAVRAQRRQAEQEQAALRVRMEQAERAAAWQRDRALQNQQEAERAHAARQQADAAQAARDAEAALPASSEGVQFVTLDLPRLPDVSSRAYAPFDPTLPPVREGDLNPKTGNRWKYGDDLPGYPSKRHYEFETDWLWDVGRLLRARHPTNLTMTEEEWQVMDSAKGHHSRL